MSKSKQSECRCPVRPRFPSWGRDSSGEQEATRRWEQEHGSHMYAQARDDLARALQYAEGTVHSGPAVLDMVADVYGLSRGLGQGAPASRSPASQETATPALERMDVLVDGGISRMAARAGIDLVTPDQWDTKGYPLPPGWKKTKEDWYGAEPMVQRMHWWMLMSGGNMSHESTPDDLREFILSGGKHKQEAK